MGSQPQVSVHLARVGAQAPAFTAAAHDLHSTASTMKLIVLLVYLRALENGTADPDREIRIHSDFPSSDGTSTFEVSREDEDDLQPWQRERAPLSWLVERMITHSSNLATDLVIEAVGLDNVVAMATACHPEFLVRRWIDDVPGIRAGILNQVSASALATTFDAVAQHRIDELSATTTDAAIYLLARNTWNNEIPAGVPDDVQVAHKNGWDTGIRHDAGIVFPTDAPAYVLVVLTTGLPDADSQSLIADISRWAWANRHQLARPLALPADLAHVVASGA